MRTPFHTCHRTKARWIFLCFVVACLISCYKDSQEVIVEVKPDEPEVIVSSDLVLETTDEHGNPVSGISYQFDGQSKLPDGPLTHFRGNDISKYDEPLIITHPDYGTIPFVVPLTENDITYATLGIVTERETEFIPGSGAVDFDLQDLVLRVKSQAFKLNNAEYTGDVTWTGFYKHIGSRADMRFVPGGRKGINLDDTPGVIIPNALFAVSAESATHEPLAFNAGKISLEAPLVSDALRAWRLDTKGIWHEVGDATYGSAIAVLSVQEPGYYCLAEWHQAVRIESRLTANGAGLAGLSLAFELNGQTIAATRTSNTGRWQALLPSGLEIQILINGLCGIVESKAVTLPMSSGALPVIDIGALEDVTTILGVARDCDDKYLDAHYIRIMSGDNHELLYFNNPEFSTTILACDGNFSVQSILSDWSESGPSILWNANAITDIHSTYACDNARNEYLVMRINGDQKLYWTAASNLTGNQRTQLLAEDLAHPDAGCTLWITGTQTGEFEDMQLNIQFEDMTLSHGGYSLYCPTSSAGCGFEKFEITHYGGTGEWIRGYFEGTFWVKTFQPLTAGNKHITGEFQVYRDF